MSPRPSSLHNRPAFLCCFGKQVVIALFFVSSYLILFPSFTAAAETIIVTVLLNQQAKGEFFVIVENGDYLVRIEDLKAMGFREPEGKVVEISGEKYLSLQSMKGVEFKFDEKKVALEISASPALLPVNQVDFAPMQQPNVYYPRDNSAFLNYGITYSGSDGSTSNTLGVANQLGVRTGDFLLLSDSNYTKTDINEKFVRLMSNITYDRREDMQRVVAGDFFASSGIFGSTANMGGLSYSKVYSMNPYFVKYPLFNFNGQVSLPSDVDVYLNGMKVRTEKVSPGEFDLQNLAVYGGSGVVDVVVRDAFGREQKITFPFYSSDVLLRQGLHEYSYNAGYLRQNFGVQSNDYGDPAASAFHRYGVNESLTIGLRAEATRGLYTYGPEASFLLSRFGVMTLSAFNSRHDGADGYAGSVNYVYQGKTVSARLFVNSYTDNFAMISRLTSTSLNPRQESGANIGFGGKDLGSLSLSYTATDNYNAPGTQSEVVTYSRNLTREIILFTSLNRAKQGEVVNKEFFIGLTYTPGKDLGVSVRHDKSGNTTTDGVQVQKSLPVGEGLGYRASLDRADTGASTSYRLNPSAQYNGRYGVYGVDYLMQRGDSGTQSSYQLSASGALAYVGNTMGLTRPVTDSFALVRAGDLPGIAVYDNNQEVGKTDSNGNLFVPNLGSYYDNRISINDKDIPINYALAETGLLVSPPLRSGSCVFFGVQQEQPITGTLVVKADNQVKPVEFREVKMKADGNEIVFPTGDNGEFYIESIPVAGEKADRGKQGCSYKTTSGKINPGTYKASFEYQGKICTFNVMIPKTDDLIIDLGQIVCDLSGARQMPQAVPVEDGTSTERSQIDPAASPLPVREAAVPASSEDAPPLLAAASQARRPSLTREKAGIQAAAGTTPRFPAGPSERDILVPDYGSKKEMDPFATINELLFFLFSLRLPS